MKIIHCADLHLDSVMETNLNKVQAKERKGEILNTFIKLVDYASQNTVEIILISGDLFDRNKISATAVNAVKNAIKNHPDIRFYYLKGNHDASGFLKDGDPVPENLFLFDDEWKSYTDSQIKITGIELTKENSLNIYDSIVLDNSDFNIVMLHGQETGSVSVTKDRTEQVNIKKLKNKGIDYLALGHVHTVKTGQIDPRGIYCYPGCLEGRGFDECGEHGFMLLDIDVKEHSFNMDFIPFASRKLFEIRTDISFCMDSNGIISEIERNIAETGCLNRDLIKIVLFGNIDLKAEKDVSYILSVFRDRFYFVKLIDETKPYIDPEDFRLDSSLKGEFVRCVMDDLSIDEADKPFVIKAGLDALTGA